MVRWVVESGEQAKSAEELLKLGRFDEAMDVAFEIKPLLCEPNHLLTSASLLRRSDRKAEKRRSRSA